MPSTFVANKAVPQKMPLISVAFVCLALSRMSEDYRKAGCRSIRVGDRSLQSRQKTIVLLHVVIQVVKVLI